MNPFTRDALQVEAEKMVEAITDPIFVERLQNFRALPHKDRFAMASVQMTPDALREAGVPVPEGMRMTSRVFEEYGLTSVRDLDMGTGRRILDLINEKRPDLMDRLQKDYPDLYDDLDPIRRWVETPPPHIGPVNPIPNPDDNFNPVAASGCACGGYATACAGAGGGT